MSLDELETAVSSLPDEELEAFARWFEAFLADAWDRRIEADIQAGRLDGAGRRADADFEAASWRQASRLSPRFLGAAMLHFVIENSGLLRRRQIKPSRM